MCAVSEGEILNKQTAVPAFLCFSFFFFAKAETTT